jgi:hypothetical protein
VAIGSLANLDGASFYINEDDMKVKGTFNGFLSRYYVLSSFLQLTVTPPGTARF